MGRVYIWLFEAVRPGLGARLRQEEQGRRKDGSRLGIFEVRESVLASCSAICIFRARGPALIWGPRTLVGVLPFPSLFAHLQESDFLYLWIRFEASLAAVISRSDAAILPCGPSVSCWVTNTTCSDEMSE